MNIDLFDAAKLPMQGVTWSLDWSRVIQTSAGTDHITR